MITVFFITKYAVIAKIVVVRLCKANTPCCKCWNDLTRLWRVYATWIVRIKFGHTEGVTEKKHTVIPYSIADSDLYDEAIEVDETKEGVRKVYVEGKEVSNTDQDILGTIFFCFSLLVLLTMYTAYLLEITFQCSDDPNYYCFTRSTNEKNPFSLGMPNYERITNRTGISYNITIHCFRYVLNGKEALVTGGGLVTIFIIERFGYT